MGEEKDIERGVGRPQIEGLKDFMLSLSVDDHAWFKKYCKGKRQPDGTLDSVSAYIRRLMAAERARIEDEAILAAAKAARK